jgi:hypothetical protein
MRAGQQTLGSRSLLGIYTHSSNGDLSPSNRVPAYRQVDSNASLKRTAVLFILMVIGLVTLIEASMLCVFALQPL